MDGPEGLGFESLPEVDAEPGRTAVPDSEAKNCSW